MFTSAKEAGITVTAFNAGKSAQAVRVQGRVTDFFERPTVAPHVDLALPPGQPVRQALPLRVLKKGFDRVALVTDAGTVIPTRAERFVVL